MSNTVVEGQRWQLVVADEDADSYQLTLSVVGGDATEGVDFRFPTHALSSTGAVVISLQTIDDDIYEGNETVLIRGVGYTREIYTVDGKREVKDYPFDRTVTVTIDDEADRPVLKVESLTTIARAGGFDVQFKVTASNAADFAYPISFDFYSPNGALYAAPLSSMMMPAFAKEVTYTVSILASPTDRSSTIEVQVASDVAGSATGTITIGDPSCIVAEMQQNMERMKVYTSLRDELSATLRDLESQTTWDLGTAASLKLALVTASSLASSVTVTGALGSAIGELAGNLINLAKRNGDPNAKDAAAAAILFANEVKVTGLEVQYGGSTTFTKALSAAGNLVNIALLYDDLNNLNAQRNAILATFRSAEQQLARLDQAISEMQARVANVDPRLVSCEAAAASGPSSPGSSPNNSAGPENKSLAFDDGAEASLIVNPASMDEARAYSVLVAAELSANFSQIAGKTIYGDLQFNTLFLNEARESVDVFKMGDFIFVEQGRSSSTIVEYERVQLADGAWLFDIGGDHFDFLYRIYAAGYGRAPDEAGFRFWIDHLAQKAAEDGGLNLPLFLAAHFLHAPEFKALYGENVADTAYVDALYLNVLGRLPDDGGYDFWIDAASKGMERDEILTHFSESKENVVRTWDDVYSGIWVTSPA